MYAIIKDVYQQFINQPASVGVILTSFIYFRIKLDALRWKQHDKEAKVFRDDVQKKAKIIEKVDRYLLKKEPDYI